MKILLIDIETAPNTAYVWGLFKENIPLVRLKESSYTLCWSAKWYGEEEVMFDSVYESTPRAMLKRVHKLLDEADAVVHYNGTRFDIPILNKEFLLHGFKPPAPYKQIDLLRTAKSQFRFTSNKLDYVADILGLGNKHTTTFELWVDCMANKPEAWATMKDYNMQDVVLLERVYEVMQPWIKGHPNASIYTDSMVCPVCTSPDVQRRGFAYTQSYKYQRFVCKTCGHWFKSGKNLGPAAGEKFVSL